MGKEEPVDKTLQRAKQIAVHEYQAFKEDATRCFDLKAIEVRLTGSQPDVSFHAGSGVRTQGGYLFFVQDLEVALTKDRSL